MKIAHIKISNILGIQDLEFTPTGFNTISGQNGKGKTSVLTAIRECLKSGHDATLLRAGETKGEVVLVLDNGTEINKSITNTSSSTTVISDGKKQAKPASIIAGLADLISVNPVEFLTAAKKDRVKILLDAMPITIDIDRLSTISGINVTMQSGVNPLSVIDAATKQVYDDRTGTNRAIKEKESTINQIELAMPSDSYSIEGDENSISASIETARELKDTELKRIDDKLRGLDSAMQSTISAIRDKLQSNIDALKSAAQSEAEKLKSDFAAISGKASIQSENTVKKFNDAVNPLQSSLAVIRSSRENIAKRQQSVLMVKKMQDELTELIADSKKQTASLTAIDAYKLELLNNLPIPGLEIKDGEIYRDDIVFDRLNTAQQVGIAVEIAKLKSGELSVMCLDGLELLDSSSLSALKQSLQENNTQAFITRVTDSEFEINSD